MITSRYGNTERVLFELYVLSKRRWSLKELANRIDCHQQTVMRDFEFIRDKLGIEIEKHRHGNGCWYSIDAEYKFPKPVGMQK